MRTKTYTKKDIAVKFSKKQNISIRKSQILLEDFFNIMKDMLIEDNPYTRIEIRNFGVFESNRQKQNLKLEILKLMKKFMFLHIKKLDSNLVSY